MSEHLAFVVKRGGKEELWDLFTPLSPFQNVPVEMAKVLAGLVYATRTPSGELSLGIPMEILLVQSCFSIVSIPLIG